MEYVRIYQIEIQGQMDENDLNSMISIQSQVIQRDGNSTRFTVDTDQSGLIGLLRHLHARGVVLISINCTS